MKEQIFTAITLSGKEITFTAKILDNGELDSEYSIVMTSKGYAIELTPQQAQDILGVTIKKNGNVIIKEQNLWRAWENEAKNIKEEIQKQKNKEELERLINENAELHLEIGYTSFGQICCGLPDGLKEKESLILNHIEFDLDPFIGDYGKSYLNIKIQDIITRIGKIELETEEKNRIKKEKQEKKKQELEEIKKNEFMIFDTEILLKTDYKLIHSLAIQYDNNKINFYDTMYKKYMDTEGTYGIKSILKENGFIWNPEEKSWEIEYTENNLEKAIEFLKKYDVKALPYELGLVQCWECGGYYPISKMKEDIAGYYCGC